MSQIEILSDPSFTNFPPEWYEIATEELFWFKWRLKVLLRQIQDIGISINEPFKTLDIGCGHGVLRRQLENNTGWVIDGCDLDKEVLLKNESNRGRTFLYNIHDRINSMEEKYDFIMLFDVLEHVKNTGDFLESALYHLKTGGYLLINVPALNCMISEYDRSLGHLRRYDRKMMIRELSGQKLQIKDMRYWGFSMLPLLLGRKLLYLKKRSKEDVIRKGMKPPSAFIDSFLKKIMYLEISTIKRPPVGTSLMVAAMKST